MAHTSTNCNKSWMSSLVGAESNVNTVCVSSSRTFSAAPASSIIGQNRRMRKHRDWHGGRRLSGGSQSCSGRCPGQRLHWWSRSRRNRLCLRGNCDPGSRRREECGGARVRGERLEERAGGKNNWQDYALFHRDLNMELVPLIGDTRGRLCV
eukprot:1055554-Rhodomonas_salina.1